MNILVVDDEKEIADVIELYLKNDRYNVLKFYTGQEALDCIASTKIDLCDSGYHASGCGRIPDFEADSGEIYISCNHVDSEDGVYG